MSSGLGVPLRGPTDTLEQVAKTGADTREEPRHRVRNQDTPFAGVGFSLAGSQEKYE